MVGFGLHKRNHDADVVNGDSGPGAAASQSETKVVIADAAQYAVDFTSFDYQTLSSDYGNAARDFTSTFAKVYLKESKATIPAIQAAKAVATSTVASAALQSFNGTAGTASVILAMDITTKNKKSPNGALTYYRFQIPMVRQPNNTWLASAINPV
jgi:hypothetical protein